jgi:hypothetical protein
MKRLIGGALVCLASALPPASAHAFCGFYVAGGDAQLFNEASQVVLVRDGDRTVITMANDFKGDVTEFALVVPVPTVIEKSQIHVGDIKYIQRIDAFTAPRLVEYFDENPCQLAVREMAAKSMAGAPAALYSARDEVRNAQLGVTIEARYTVGEYDILLLSAKQSTGLAIWLRENHYRVPDGAARVLTSYIRDGMKFFVAKVNLKEQQKLGFTTLRPIQIAYEDARFTLPIRLGMANANGPQDLLVYAITRQGRVETTNYRTVKLPSDVEIPDFVKDDFANFYRDMFREQVRKNDSQVVFTEYAWNLSWCDPCASAPLTPDELRGLGVFWLDGTQPSGRGGAQDAFVTRLHVRYDAQHFPMDLVLQVTSDRTNFQGRYVMRHFWNGDESCPAAQQYRAGLAKRRADQARALADLTGWDLGTIRGRMAVAADWTAPEDRLKWWQRIWKD